MLNRSLMELNGRDVELTTHLYLMPRFRMSEWLCYRYMPFRCEWGTTSFPLAIQDRKLCFITGPPDYLIYSVGILSSH